jgi:hypothetical protein
MKYFDEEKMAETRKTFEAEVLEWKGVVSRPMMGCLCHFYNRKFVCFLVTNGIVLMKLSEKDQTLLKTCRLWVTPLKGPKVVRSVMPLVRKRYEEVSSTHAKTDVLMHLKSLQDFMSRSIAAGTIRTLDLC